ncbi:MAG: hypothetical protein ABEH88_04370, partial [Halobacteriales archaeon]
MFESTPAAAAFVLGRALFAIVIGYLALGNLRDLESAVGYTTHKGAPFPSITVPLGSLGLIAGAGAVLLGVYKKNQREYHGPPCPWVKRV